MSQRVQHSGLSSSIPGAQHTATVENEMISPLAVRDSITTYSVASSRTRDTDYGLFYTRRALSTMSDDYWENQDWNSSGKAQVAGPRFEEHMERMSIEETMEEPLPKITAHEPPTSRAFHLLEGASHEIADHTFFTQRPVPSYIPPSAHDAVPDFRHMTKFASASKPSPSSESGLASGGGSMQEIGMRRKELEKKAWITAQIAPVREQEDGDYQGWKEDEEDEQEGDKRRIPREKGRYGSGGDRENVAPTPATPSQRYATRSTRDQVASGDKENMHTAAPTSKLSFKPTRTTTPTHNALAPPLELNGFDPAAQTLSIAFAAKAAGRVFRDPYSTNGLSLPLPDERVFIVSWVDYCNKYGLGYALTDGSFGVHFNDSTTLVLSADKVHFDYTTSRHAGTVYVRKSYTVDMHPEELKSKVYLFKQFERYIMERLYGEYEYTYKDVDREKGMEWVQKYLRMKHVVMFKLSHDVLQFNFYDHSKVILSSNGLLVTHIDKHYKLTRHLLKDIMAASLSRPLASSSQQEQAAAKFNRTLVDKLRYCRDVLVGIENGNPNAIVNVAGAEIEDSQTIGRALADVNAAAALDREKERREEREREEEGVREGLAGRASKTSATKFNQRLLKYCRDVLVRTKNANANATANAGGGGAET